MINKKIPLPDMETLYFKKINTKLIQIIVEK